MIKAYKQSIVYLDKNKLSIESERKGRWWELVSLDFEVVFNDCCDGTETIEAAIEKTICSYFDPDWNSPVKVVYSNYWIKGEHLLCLNEKLSHQWSEE